MRTRQAAAADLNDSPVSLGNDTGNFDVRWGSHSRAPGQRAWLWETPLPRGHGVH
jgi:hypothetical protein